LCAACGRRLAERRLRVSGKFTAYPDLFAGLEVCSACAELIEGRRYRSSHWILREGGGIELLTRERLLEVLRDPPVGSLVYVRSSGKRHGFVRALRYRSSSRFAAVCGEEEGALLVERERLRELVELAERALSALKRKRALLEGCSPSEWVHEELCRKIEEVRGDPLWRVVARAL